MADHDELQSEEFHERLVGVASTVDVGRFEQERSKVDGVVGRRRTRRRAGATLGAVVAVGLVATAVVLALSGSEPDTLVTTDDTMASVTLPTTASTGPSPP